MTNIEIIKAVQEKFSTDHTFHYFPVIYPNAKFVLCVENNKRVFVFLCGNLDDIEKTIWDQVNWYPINYMTVFAIGETKFEQVKIQIKAALVDQNPHPRLG